MRIFLRVRLSMCMVCAVTTAFWAVCGVAEEGNHPVATPATQKKRITKPLIIRALVYSNELKLVSALDKAFAQPERCNVGFDFNAGIGRFCDKEAPFDVLVTAGEKLDSGDQWGYSHRFPSDQPQPLVIPIAQRRIAFVVASTNSVDQIELSQVRELIGPDAAEKSWRKIMGKGPEGTMKTFGSAIKTATMQLLRNRCLQRWETDTKNVKYLRIDRIRADMKACKSQREILNSVRAAGSTGLGIIELPGSASMDFDSLKLLKIRVDSHKVIQPKTSAVVQLEYPIAETITFYIHPRAIEQARLFVDFCLSEEGAKVCRDHGYTSPRHEAQASAKKRQEGTNRGAETPN